MIIDRQILARMLRRTATLWLRDAQRLSEIDSRFGDGDHGVTIGKMANLINARLDAWTGIGIKSFIDDLATGITGIAGGSAGPLYGTFIEGLAIPLNAADTGIDAPMLKQMLASGLAELRDLTKARIGDKTMMDAIIPAVEAAQAAPDDIPDILNAAASASARGSGESGRFIAKFGRARSYGEKTVGTPDVGALSASLMFQGLAEGLREI